MSGPLPAAGWYEDPRGEADLRWWNGSAWTAHTSARPDAPAPAVVTPASSPGAQPTIEIGGRSRPLASWWPRAVAYVIDALVKFAFSIPFLIGFGVIAAGIDWKSIDLQKLQEGPNLSGTIPGLTAADTAQLGAAFIVLVAGWLLVELTYQPITMARSGKNNGRTWGMQALGIRVLRDNGQPMSYGPALVREFLVMGLLYGLVGLIGNAVAVVGGTLLVLTFYLWPLWDAQNRALQDFICSTHVVSD